jgi:hypothetical protein
MAMTTHSKTTKMMDAGVDGAENFGKAVADLVTNVVDNALRLVEEVARDASRIATSARDVVRSMLNG